jgi:hypothetical protein
MGTQTADSSAYVKGIRFVGRETGAVKALGGFQKSRHKVPDAINPTTSAFLARLCEDDLREAAEACFQNVRSACAYKRKDLTLTVGSPQALMTAKDFSLEIVYSFEGDDPESYQVQWTLSGLGDVDFARSSACAEVFSGRFSELVFSLTKGARVESVIDAVEGLQEGELRVDYPSDYGHCLLSVEGVDAQVRFDGAELAMVFPRGGNPGELLDGFLLVREAFSLTKERILSGLLR